MRIAESVSKTEGLDVNAKDEKGRTALSFASAAKKIEIVEYQKAHGAE